MRADAVRNHERLVEVARNAFARNGIDASLEEIAREAGVGIGTLYRRFPTREDLVQAVLADQYDQLADEAMALSTGNPPFAALDLWLRQLFQYMSIYRGLALPVKAAILDRNTALGRTCIRMLDAGDELVRTAQQAGEVRPDVRFKDVAAMTSGVVWAGEQSAGKHDGDAVPPALMLDIMIAGLRAR